MTINSVEATSLFIIAFLGHLMALIWLFVEKQNLAIADRRIYDIPAKSIQIRRELKNSIHAPTHAIILWLFLWLGCFAANGIYSFFLTLLLTFVWAEVWHYASHRAFHHPKLHWIHVEHHKSRVNTPFSAISFSFYEKIIFDFGLLLPLALMSLFLNLNFLGICAWYIGYIFINSFSHANFEMKSESFIPMPGRILTSTTYHSLHHARYNKNYGLGTRILDRIFGTEWVDYENVFHSITCQRRPLKKLNETVKGLKQ